MTETLTLSPLIAWVGALSLLLNFALSLYGLLSSGARANKLRLDRHEQQFSEHDKRITSAEQTLTGLPSNADMHRIELLLARMEGSLGAMEERLKPVAAIAERVQELLIQQAKR